MRRFLALSLPAILLLSGVTLVASNAAASDQLWDCQSLLNDDGTCAGSVCAGNGGWGECAPQTTEKVCTQGHAPCQGLDVLCVYGPKVNECLMGCACYIGGAATTPQPCVDCPTYPIVCVSGVTAGTCGDGDDVCVSIGTLPRHCEDLPGTTCNVPCQQHVECVVFVGSGAAAATCFVDGREVGPVQTCDTCAVLFGVTCQVGTDANACDGVSPPPCACIPASQPQPIPVALCVRSVNAAHCTWAGQDHPACVTISQQVPQCLPDPGVVFTCGDLAPACSDPTNPCAWGWIECGPSGLPPVRAASPVECMEYYWSQDFGPVSVTMRDSCHVSVEQHVLA
ncbi:MAG: hypothetical protein QOE90_3153 [Thermoplasmata archaeon]|jgi:hypothetical protein|nr:hypothetical protein [Thermoplasmata archaeon]